MPHLIEVAFKGNRKDFFLWEQDSPPPLKAAVIVDADRGEDLGFVYSFGELAEKRNSGTAHGYGAAGSALPAGASPVGGGGLLMGLSEHLLHQPAPMRLVGCEPYNYPTYAPFSHERSRTIADGLVLEEPHAKVRERIRQLGIGIELVQESAMRTAMRDLYEQQGLVVEPSSAITVAAARARLAHLEEPICLILTGANISCHDFYQLIG